MLGPGVGLEVKPEVRPWKVLEWLLRWVLGCVSVWVKVFGPGLCWFFGLGSGMGSKWILV